MTAATASGLVTVIAIACVVAGVTLMYDWRAAVIVGGLLLYLDCYRR